jgi:hypothetical protein
MLIFILLVVLIVLVGVGKALGAIGMGILVVLGLIVGAVSIFFGVLALMDLGTYLHKRLIARKRRLEEEAFDKDTEDEDEN